MYNNSKNILTGVLCAIVIAAIAVGVLFACGVFKKDVTTKTKLPISYPDKTINWMSLDDGKTLRAAFDDKLDLNEKTSLRLVLNINNLKDNVDVYLRLKDDSTSVFDYETWEAGSNGFYGFSSMNSNNEETQYHIIVRIYNNASLSESGDVLDGTGFVLSVGELQQVIRNEETGDETYEDVEIESFRLLSIAQDTINKLLK